MVQRINHSLRRWARWNGTDFFTAIGWSLARICGARIQWRGGVALAYGGHLPQILRRHPAGAVSAMVIGRIILAQDKSCLQKNLRHEWVHIRQFLRWGALFPLLYGLESLQLLLRGRRAYWDNRFEQEARAKEFK